MSHLNRILLKTKRNISRRRKLLLLRRLIKSQNNRHNNKEWNKNMNNKMVTYI